MLTYVIGDLFRSPAKVLVNTVNVVGVMGKGLALMFKKAFPQNFLLYAEACKRKDVRVGEMFVTEHLASDGPRWIINFPTKKHWRDSSQLQWVIDGLQDLRHIIEGRGIRSIAVPPLGCGLGGLDWNVVRPEIACALGGLPNVDVLVFAPDTAHANPTKSRRIQA